MLQYLQVGNKTVSVGGEGGEARVCMERWVWYCVLELQTKVHTKVHDHGEGPY